MVDDNTDTNEPTGTDDTTDDTSTSEDTQDLDKVDDDKLKDLDEKTQKLIKGFQADYTKKTQKLADERKQFEDKLKVGEKWWEFEQDPSNQKIVEEFNEYKAKKLKDDEPDAADDDDDDTSLDDPDVKKVKKSVAQMEKEMAEFKQVMQISLKMQNDLFSELQAKDIKDLPFPIDPRKVVDHAKANNMVDMRKAIRDCYADEIKEHEFQNRLTAEKDKWVEQQKTNVLTPTMPQGRTVRKVLARDRDSTK